MTLQVLIVEDEDLFADQLEMLVDKLGYEHLGTVDNSDDALELIEKQQADLILMDIQIEGEYDGIELSDMIHKRWPIPIIFITSLDDRHTFKRASRVNPINFLLKPFDQRQLQRSIEFSVSQLNRQSENSVNIEAASLHAADASAENQDWQEDFLHNGHLFIKVKQRLVKVAINDILYLESDGHYCQVHLPTKKFLIRIKMADLLKRLGSQKFAHAHRSFYVNIDKVDGVDLEQSLILLAEKQVPLSKRNREQFLSQLDYL